MRDWLFAHGRVRNQKEWVTLLKPMSFRSMTYTLFRDRVRDETVRLIVDRSEGRSVEQRSRASLACFQPALSNIIAALTPEERALVDAKRQRSDRAPIPLEQQVE